METEIQQKKEPKKSSGVELYFSIVLLVRSIILLIYPSSIYLAAFLIIPVIAYAAFFVCAITLGILGLTDCDKNKRSIIESILSISFSLFSVLLPIIFFSTKVVTIPAFM